MNTKKSNVLDLPINEYNMKYFNSNEIFFSFRTRLDNHDQPTANVFLTQNDSSSDLRSDESTSVVPKLPQITAASTMS
jgi:hypothetical protein